MTPPQPRDRLLQPFRLKHLTLRHSQDGLSKERGPIYDALRL